jgi:hypothetical protein
VQPHEAAIVKTIDEIAGRRALVDIVAAPVDRVGA